jgi:hypothetical protein
LLHAHYTGNISPNNALHFTENKQLKPFVEKYFKRAFVLRAAANKGS